MKKNLLSGRYIYAFIFLCFYIFGLSQTEYQWRSEASNGNWDDGNNWWDGSSITNTGFGVQLMSNNNQTNMVNNFAGTFNTFKLVFGNGATDSRTISGNPFRMFDYSGYNPKIENFSTATHTFNTSINGDGDAADPLEINLQSTGGLIWNGFVNNQGSWVDFYGLSNAIARFNGVISGTGGIGVKTKTIVALNAANTYTGNTEIDEGEIWLEDNGGIFSLSNVYLGNGGKLDKIAKLFLAKSSGGQVLNNAINVNIGNSNTRYLGSLNNSGTNEFSGAIIKNNDAGLNFEIVNIGATLAVTGGMSNRNTVINKIGAGKLIFSKNNFNINSQNIYIKNGILEVDVFPSRFGGNSSIIIGDEGFSTLRILDTSSAYTSSFVSNGYGGAIEFNSQTNRSFSGAYLLNADLLINNQSTKNLEFSNVISGSKNFIINSTGTGGVILSYPNNNFTGNTIVKSGSLFINPTGNATYNSKLVLDGGILSTQGISANVDFVSSNVMSIASSSIISLRDNFIHSLRFANSSSEVWNGNISITGWSGEPGAAGSGGTLGRIYFGNNNTSLTAQQLNLINFEGYGAGAELTSSGELVPRDYLRFYSTGVSDANDLTSWNSKRDGTGIVPSAFDISKARFYIQNTHSLVTTSDWNLNAAYNYLIIENGGTLLGNHSITLASTSNFVIEDNAKYIHNNSNSLASNIFAGTENFASNSYFELKNWPSGVFAAINQYGNLTISGSTNNSLQFSGNLKEIKGNFEISNTGSSTVRLTSGSNVTTNVGGNFILNNGIIEITNGTGNVDFNINGNFTLNGGVFKFQDSSTGVSKVILNGSNVTLTNGFSFSGSLPTTSGFYFNRIGEQNLYMAQAFSSGDYRNRFYFNNAQTKINEIYNGSVAQQSINGSGSAPAAGFSSWPINTDNGINDLQILNPAGVVLRNSRKIGNNIIINNGGHLQVNPNIIVTVVNEINNINGTAAFEDNSALLQINKNAINSGKVTIKKDAKLKRLDYIYWSSPVIGQNLKAFSPGTLDSRFYLYDESSDYFVSVASPSTTTFQKGTGYGIRASNTLSTTPTTFNGIFSGVPNNGDISVNLSKLGNGYNLVGNPYPSDLNLDQLYADNSDDITGTFYFWTNINPNPAMQGSNYPKEGYYNNYAVYNLSGGTPAASAAICNQNCVANSPTPTNYVKPGQGFIIQAKDVNKALDFNNNQRNYSNSAPFFNNYRIANINNDRFWVQLISPLKLVNTILIAYKKGSSKDFEENFDAKLLVESPDSFYSKLQTDKFTIQGRGYPFDTHDKIELGASFYQNGSYTISIANKEGVFENGQSIYLYDKKLGIYTDIQKEDYVFDAQQGEDSSRFEIVYQPKSNLTTHNVNSEQVKIYENQDNLVIESDKIFNRVVVYDVTGKLLKSIESGNKNSLLIEKSQLSRGIYLINIIFADKIVNKKISFK